jgi:heme-degrading monooxygenase HmoA
MLCALTVRTLKPGAEEDFRQVFAPSEETEPPPGWQRFFALRNVADANEIITFGFFDGTLEEMRQNQEGSDYDERRAQADQFVESVGTDGVFEVVEERTMQ